MNAQTILLTISITLNIFLLAIILILWFRKCKECGKDKEISRAFSPNCEKCNKGKSNGNGKYKQTTIF